MIDTFQAAFNIATSDFTKHPNDIPTLQQSVNYKSVLSRHATWH